MKPGILIKNVIIIAVLLTVVFLSQQPYFQAIGKQYYGVAEKQGSEYWAKANDWITANIWPKVGGGVSTLKDSATTEITKQKNNFVQNLWENFKNYFAGKFSSIFGTKVK